MQGIGLGGGTPTFGILNALHIALPAAMAELHDELAIEIVDALAHFFPEGNLVVGIHHGVVRQDAAAAMNGDEGRDDGRYATAGESGFPIDAGWATGTVVVIEAPRHVGADEPVLQSQIAKCEWLENGIRQDGLLGFRKYGRIRSRRVCRHRSNRWRRCGLDQRRSREKDCCARVSR